MKILIVDSDEAIFEIIRVYLEGIGHSAVYAKDSDYAIAILTQAEHKDIALVVIDWKVPRHGAYELISRIRGRVGGKLIWIMFDLAQFPDKTQNEARRFILLRVANHRVGVAIPKERILTHVQSELPAQAAR